MVLVATTKTIHYFRSFKNQNKQYKLSVITLILLIFRCLKMMLGCSGAERITAEL